jgi:hypothetical protein
MANRTAPFRRSAVIRMPFSTQAAIAAVEICAFDANTTESISFVGTRIRARSDPVMTSADRSRPTFARWSVM